MGGWGVCWGLARGGTVTSDGALGCSVRATLGGLQRLPVHAAPLARCRFGRSHRPQTG